MYKTCSKCGQTKETKEFNASAKAPDSLHKNCKTCQPKEYVYKTPKNPVTVTLVQKVDKYLPKTCVKCKKIKDLDVFPSDSESFDGTGKGTKCYDCCYAAHVKSKGPFKAYTVEAYIRACERNNTKYELLDAQKGLCAICHKASKSNKMLALDHNHKTGELRELLCMNCNLMLGLIHEDIETLQSAINYLKKWETKNIETVETQDT